MAIYGGFIIIHRFYTISIKPSVLGKIIVSERFFVSNNLQTYIINNLNQGKVYYEVDKTGYQGMFKLS